MEVFIKSCCGLDVHKKTVVACIRIADESGKVKKEVRTFGTMTKDIQELDQWLKENGVTHIAMESTGVYWKPIWNILEGHYELLLVNAQHIKQVPGRKTDVKDCEWIANLLQYGLLKASFVPETFIRELRDLTRHKARLAQLKVSIGNRIQKVLEDANIKLASVASDILGVSCLNMLKAIISGSENPEELAELAKRKLRNKIPELKLALFGRITEHHKFMLSTLVSELEHIESTIEQVSQRIIEKMAPYEKEILLLMEIPGIDRINAENILVEIGFNMSQFPSADCLASWAGMCPGNNESAGKKKSGKTTKGNKWLRRALSQSAWGASHTKDTYLSEKYRRLASRRGRNRAVVAVGHKLLIIIYYMLKEKVHFKDLGAEHFAKLNPERQKRYYVNRLENLGYNVNLEEKAA
jgi:transposase